MNLEEFIKINVLSLPVISEQQPWSQLLSKIEKVRLLQMPFFCHNGAHVIYVRFQSATLVSIYDSMGKVNFKMPLLQAALDHMGICIASESWTNYQPLPFSSSCTVLAVLFSLGLRPTNNVTHAQLMGATSGIKQTLVEIQHQFHSYPETIKTSLVLNRHPTCLCREFPSSKPSLSISPA